MSVKRIFAVCLIFLLASGGWMILGTATTVRSTELFSRLSGQVEQLWGQPVVQQAPVFSVAIPGTDQVRRRMPVENRIEVQIEADYRQKGLMWYSTYNCSFDGRYTITNDDPVVQKVRMHFDFPVAGGTYDNFAVTVDDQPFRLPVDTRAGIGEIVELEPGASRTFRFTYRTRGMRDWRYQTDPEIGRLQNLDLTVRTSFADVDYTPGSLSPMTVEPDGQGGMRLNWTATDLITTGNIGIIMPEKLNPGPLTTRITFFAPVCLLFFFVLVGAINILYKVNIHPMHYLFVAAGFFAFHLLLSYMVGIVNIHLAFAVSAAVTVALVTLYMTAALKGRFPWKIAVAAQLFFLVLFSYSFFFKGITGLTVAVGSVVTLAVLMKVTAGIDWNEVFKQRTAAESAG